MNPFVSKNSKLKVVGGFTLIEMLLVLALIAILAGIVIISINPGRQLADARNRVRVSNLNSIIEAVYQYSFDHQGSWPAGITKENQEICRTGAPSCVGFVDLKVLTDHKKYLVSIPSDPLVTEGNGTGYLIMNDEGRVNMTAKYAEEDEVINIIR